MSTFINYDEEIVKRKEKINSLKQELAHKIINKEIAMNSVGWKTLKLRDEIYDLEMEIYVIEAAREAYNESGVKQNADLDEICKLQKDHMNKQIWEQLGNGN